MIYVKPQAGLQQKCGPGPVQPIFMQVNVAPSAGGFKAKTEPAYEARRELEGLKEDESADPPVGPTRSARQHHEESECSV